MWQYKPNLKSRKFRTTKRASSPASLYVCIPVVISLAISPPFRSRLIITPSKAWLRILDTVAIYRSESYSSSFYRDETVGGEKVLKNLSALSNILSHSNRHSENQQDRWNVSFMTSSSFPWSLQT